MPGLAPTAAVGDDLNQMKHVMVAGAVTALRRRSVVGEDLNVLVHAVECYWLTRSAAGSPVGEDLNSTTAASSA